MLIKNVSTKVTNNICHEKGSLYCHYYLSAGSRILTVPISNILFNYNFIT